MGGNMPGHVTRSGTRWREYFDEKLALKPDPKDASTEVCPKSSLKDLISARVGPERYKSTTAEDQKYVLRGKRFASLLGDILCMEPVRRPKPLDALEHEFFTG